MEDKKQKKKIVPENNKARKVKPIDPKHLQEQEQLFHESDRISPINKKIDEKEVVKTIGGDEINVRDYVKENYLEYSGQDTHYFKETFYYPLADMFGVSRSLMDNYVKPTLVPNFINAFILSRFPQKVINRIHEKNRYIFFCSRRYHHYQVMTKKADIEYRGFIKDVEDILNRNPQPTLKEFKNEYCTKYRLPIQEDLFGGL